MSLKFRAVLDDDRPLHISGDGGPCLVFGSAVHKAREWLHKARKEGGQPRLEDLLRVFEADWHAQCLDGEVRFNDDTSAAQLLVKGKELLSAYCHRPTRPVHDAELFFQVPLVNPATGDVLDVPLRGVIDLIEADDTLVEFKTSQKPCTLADLPDNLQLTAYSYAYELLYGRPPKELRLVNLVRTRNPVIEKHLTGRDETDYERLFHLSTEVLKGIQTGVFFPNRGCWLCRDCEYEQDCREWTGNEEDMERSR